MKRSESKAVLSLKIWFHGEDVVESHLRPCEACPMERSTLFVVSNVDINSLLPQVIQTQGLVLLRSYVHDCGSILVLD
jgi:hypothetical protein